MAYDKSYFIQWINLSKNVRLVKLFLVYTSLTDEDVFSAIGVHFECAHWMVTKKYLLYGYSKFPIPCRNIRLFKKCMRMYCAVWCKMLYNVIV